MILSRLSWLPCWKSSSTNKSNQVETTRRVVSTKSHNFGPDVSVAPTSSYISILRKGKKFAIIQVTSERLDIGIKLKGAETTDRFEAAGAWNSMVTHRVHVSNPKQINAEVFAWLKQAFDEALSIRSRASAS